ncbi:MAG: hypothetical protein K2P84_00100 [Undibacterium sp.]|nr:hypothetical protein [Undibacterium sp.]
MSKIKVLRVVSKSSSFRRAGYQFSAEPRDIPLTEIADEQRAAIEADPQLIAYQTEIDAPETLDSPVSKSAKK